MEIVGRIISKCGCKMKDPGIPNPANLFVPFFTTKPSGSGIGLVLSRQIAEAHRGTLTLENVPAVTGEARLRSRVSALPLLG